MLQILGFRVCQLRIGGQVIISVGHAETGLQHAQRIAVGLLAILADEWTITQKPSEVTVGSPRWVKDWMVRLPSTLSAHDVIDVKEKSWDTTPFIVARETHGERVVPAWLEAFPDRMRIFVHQLPVRAQIDLPIQEQLIVEYYSKL